MSIRFVIVTLGLIAGAAQGVAAETAIDTAQERGLSDQEQRALMSSPAYDVLKGSARVILQAVACGDAQMAAKAQSLAEAALAAQGVRPTQSMVAAATAAFARDQQAKHQLATDCPASLKEAADTLAELSR